MRPTTRAGAAWAAARHQVVAATLDGVTATLLAEYAGRLSPASVLDEVDRACAQLLAAGVRAGLSPATESLARVRLRARAAGSHPERHPTAQPPPGGARSWRCASMN